MFLATMLSLAMSPNIHTNLTGEHSYVKRKTTEYELSQSSRLSFVKNKHNLSPNSVVSTPKHPQHQIHEESPTPTLTRYCLPVPPPKFIGKSAPGATRVVKKSAVAQQWELIESYDSDSGLEMTDLKLAKPFVTHTSRINSTTPSINLTTPSINLTTSSINLTTSLIN